MSLYFECSIVNSPSNGLIRIIWSTFIHNYRCFEEQMKYPLWVQNWLCGHPDGTVSPEHRKFRGRKIYVILSHHAKFVNMPSSAWITPGAAIISRLHLYTTASREARRPRIERNFLSPTMDYHISESAWWFLQFVALPFRLVSTLVTQVSTRWDLLRASFVGGRSPI